MKRDIFCNMVCMLSVLLVFQRGMGQEVEWHALQGLGEVKYHRLESNILEQTYHLFISLPQDYNTTEKYPSIYILDGGWAFPVMAGYYNYLSNDEEIPKSIIVGISYGTNDWQKGNQRSRDFTAKSKERKFWGGADNFCRVLSKEIFPIIENNYAAEPLTRVIFGQSLGGQFVLYCAMTAPEMFMGYIASNPALHRNLEFFLDEKNLQESAPNMVKFFVSSGSDDDPRFREPAIAWINHWTNNKNIPWELKTITLDGHTHFSAPPEAFRQGIKWIFEEVK